MFVTNALFPMDGLAATITRLPGWKPPVIVSRSVKPDGVPVMATPSVESLCQISISCSMIEPAFAKALAESSWATSSMERSACSTISRGRDSRPCTEAWISYVACRRRRMSDISLTISP